MRMHIYPNIYMCVCILIIMYMYVYIYICIYMCVWNAINHLQVNGIESQWFLGLCIQVNLGSFALLISDAVGKITGEMEMK